MTLSNRSRVFWLSQEATLYSMILKNHIQTFEKQEREELIGYLPDLREKKVLELGAGIGRFTSFLAQQATTLLAIDLVPQFLEKNKKDNSNFPHVSFLCADVMDLEFKEGLFDVIFFNWLFTYLEDGEVEQLLEKISRWLSPQGELFFRETCDLKRSKKEKGDYFAHYREPRHYESLANQRFQLVKEGYIKTYVDQFADPLHCYWHYRKKPTTSL